MRLGFFLAVRHDVTHFLHAASLVREAKRHLPLVEVVQLTDQRTAAVPGVDTVIRHESAASLLEQRLTHYAGCSGEWLLVDTDVSIRADVRGVFDDPVFDVALTDRNWPHAPVGETFLHEMPFNTGVVFTRSSLFWPNVLMRWMRLPERERDWLSEQRVVAEVVRTGHFRVKILPGMAYNYPPEQGQVPEIVALAHYKGPRKVYLSPYAYKVLST